LRYLDAINEQVEVLGVDRISPNYTPTNYSYKFQSTGIFNRSLDRKDVSDFQPNYILHLAATSSVGESLRKPEEVMLNNITSLLNVTESIDSKLSKSCRILVVSSSEVYADSNDSLEETSPCNVQKSPYSFSKSVCELIAKKYCEEHNFDIVTTRSFMHTGPNQNEKFVVASFIKQITDAKKQNKNFIELKTGNIDIARDITDVRDVVRAYYLLLKHGKKNEIYNVCSGKTIKLRSIIDLASEIIGVSVSPIIDPQRLRPNDPQVVVGNNKKILKEINWQPQIPIKQTLQDMINCEFLKTQNLL
jgi:GDP-4-dehydro-6-deoxy-D-mannose reductase